MFFRTVGSEILQLFSFFQGKKRTYFLGLFGDAAGQAGTLVCLPFVFKDLTDFAISKDPALLSRAIVLMSVTFLVLSILSPTFCYFYRRTVREVIKNVRLAIFRRMVHLPSGFYERQHSGEIMSRLGNDVQVMEQAYFEHLKSMSVIVVTLIGSLAGMFLLDWRFASVLVFFSTATLYLNSRVARSVRAIADQMQQQMGVQTERLTDLLSGLPVIKMFQLHKVVTQRYTEVNEEITVSAVKQGHKSALLESMNFLIHFLSFGGTLVCGIIMAAKGFVQMGSLVAIVQQQLLVTMSFLQLGQVITALQGSLAGAFRIQQFLEQPPEPERYDTLTGEQQSNGSALNLQHVVFGYEDGPKVLDGISLTVDQGQTAALVGASGSGKSTVFKLLLGYYPPQDGGIHLLGKPLGAYTLAETRQMIAYVPQDAYLFAGTIEENIRYGCRNASEQELIEACKAAYAHDFITELPEGYQTRVGERGAMLSGGQRQRIAIARAILKNAPILLLDEATSALDAESEYWVQQALNVLMKNRTTLVIAHRLSTIQQADIIYVMDRGKVVEQGRHQELLSLHGAYARLYEGQKSQEHEREQEYEVSVKM
ncbi:ABC transporter ATP-binding protein [Brevibacillus borstelensis]|uniref:ABC transporter ATP-binding protein n=1 Tax=Brevibacillus borstelensis TaxID=45462 RepID=UPI0030C5D5AE